MCGIVGGQGCQSGDQLQDVHLWREFSLALILHRLRDLT